MISLGEKLEILVSKGQQEVILAAPYIKTAILQRIFNTIKPQVTVHCVTRWRPEEIIAGVSDLEVWDIICDRPNSTLRLHPTLHAKYYRADEQCLIGSANLTATALGWRTQSNLELLFPVPASDPLLEIFESTLFRQSREVTNVIARNMRETVEELSAAMPPSVFTPLHNDEDESLNQASNPEAWLPELWNPQLLYSCYLRQQGLLHDDEWITGRNDLAHLQVPRGLSERLFDQYIGVVLLQQPIVREVDARLVTAQRFGAIRDLLRRLPCAEQPGFDATRGWQILMDWLFYFMPERYRRVPSNYSEVVVKIY